MANIKVTRPDNSELSELRINEWSPWECEPSNFDWEYDDEEWCYLFEGRASIKTCTGVVEIKKGDLVKFSKGLKCNWNVTEKVKKVYAFK
jgi:uncharacterized cupin superfamily protein